MPFAFSFAVAVVLRLSSRWGVGGLGAWLLPAAVVARVERGVVVRGWHPSAGVAM